jgi:multiple sugar transport system permease protein
MFPQMRGRRPDFQYVLQAGSAQQLFRNACVFFHYAAAAVWIMVRTLSAIPLSIEDGPRAIDGCTQWKTLGRVIFPIALPGVFTCAISVHCGLERIPAYDDVNADKALSKPSGCVQRAENAVFNPLGENNGGNVVSFIPSLIIVLLFQKQIVSGMVSGAVKNSFARRAHRAGYEDYKDILSGWVPAWSRSIRV